MFQILNEPRLYSSSSESEQTCAWTIVSKCRAVSFCDTYNPSGENRAALLDAGLPQELANLLESYADMCPEIPCNKEISLPEIHLKIVRTIVGALLNLTTDFGVHFPLQCLETVLNSTQNQSKRS